MGKTVRVLSVCVSDRKGVAKHSIGSGRLRVDWGLEGDAHAGNWHRQVSLLARESIERAMGKGVEVPPGSFAENILTQGLELYTLPVGTHMRLGSALVELTQIGKECHAHCSIFELMGDCVMPREGVFVVVLEDGEVREGDTIEILKSESNATGETGER